MTSRRRLSPPHTRPWTQRPFSARSRSPSARTSSSAASKTPTSSSSTSAPIPRGTSAPPPALPQTAPPASPSARCTGPSSSTCTTRRPSRPWTPRSAATSAPTPRPRTRPCSISAPRTSSPGPRAPTSSSSFPCARGTSSTASPNPRAACAPPASSPPPTTGPTARSARASRWSRISRTTPPRGSCCAPPRTRGATCCCMRTISRRRRGGGGGAGGGSRRGTSSGVEGGTGCTSTGVFGSGGAILDSGRVRGARPGTGMRTGREILETYPTAVIHSSCTGYDIDTKLLTIARQERFRDDLSWLWRWCDERWTRMAVGVTRNRPTRPPPSRTSLQLKYRFTPAFPSSSASKSTPPNCGGPCAFSRPGGPPPRNCAWRTVAPFPRVLWRRTAPTGAPACPPKSCRGSKALSGAPSRPISARPSSPACTSPPRKPERGRPAETTSCLEGGCGSPRTPRPRSRAEVLGPDRLERRWIVVAYVCRLGGVLEAGHLSTRYGEDL
ncbi:hypothetical protein DFJ74DRAFT_305026 [Hyaloraphidium curvatum]|nr:hypothetical protein DFJ74DRAFT_305026 [Hyaloraphidium curvatum]